ncbi:hypothetical protein [Nocardia sp. NPDC004260]
MEQTTIELLRRPLLARAMLVSVNAVRSAGAVAVDTTMRDRIVAVAGIATPDTEDYQLARLVEQCIYGILTWAVAGQLDAAEAASDVRRACTLLLVRWVDRGQ